jgi:hypothetical protein
MRIEFDYQGKTYRGEEIQEQSMDEFVDNLYEEMNEIKKIKMVLDDGSTMIAGEIALKSGVLRIIP